MLHLKNNYYTLTAGLTMGFIITSSKLQRIIVRMSALLLLIVYVSATSHLELIHSFVHEHKESILHSAEHENDPCHRLLYHSDNDEGCHHDSHLVVLDKCQMCDLACHGDQTITSDLSYLVNYFKSKPGVFYKSHLESYSAVIYSSRAPPVRA
jgi:hypothetical protein